MRMSLFVRMSATALGGDWKTETSGCYNFSKFDEKLFNSMIDIIKEE